MTVQSHGACPECGAELPTQGTHSALCLRCLLKLGLEKTLPIEDSASVPNGALPGLAEGRRLGHFEILGPIGAGAMGTVYRARDTKLGREIAIKVLPEEFAAERERLARFKREAKALAALNHPNVVTVHSVEEIEGVHFLTMELVRGETLGELIPKGGLPLDELLRMAVPLADALHAAHERGVTHRDLKPSNVMVSEEGRLKVLDFGLAKVAQSQTGAKGDAEEATRAGEVFGTLPYMSPEHVRGESVDGRSDIFALGIILFEMATGDRPFHGDTPAELVSSILRDAPPEVADLREDLPKAFSRIVGKCLDKAPERRYRTARDVGAGLEDLDSEMAAKPWQRRPLFLGTKRRWLAGLLSAGVLIAVLVALFSWRGTGQIDSLAVLPFRDLTGDPEQEYFVDGMTEELIAQLLKIGALRVISHQSVMEFRSSDRPIPEIAKRLDVQAVVTGTVRSTGDRVRITVHLSEASPERLLWSGSYDRDLEDVLTLHREIAREVSREIRVELTPEEEGRLLLGRTVRPDAYRAYLRGRYQWNKRTPQSIARSIALFERSIELDPDSARAYAGLADAFNLLGGWGYGVLPPEEAMPKAREFATRSLELDPDLAEAYVSLGHVELFYAWDWSAAENAFVQAIERSPNYATAHQWYGIYLMTMGREVESLYERELAFELDPLSPILATDVATAWYYTGHYERAIERYLDVLAGDPDFLMAHLLLGRAYLQMSMFSEAFEELEEAAEMAPESALALGLLGQAHALAGQTDSAHRVLERLQELAARKYVPAHAFLPIYLGLGDLDEAFASLERAFDERSGLMVFLHIEPQADLLRSDPRFTALLEKIGLEPPPRVPEPTGEPIP